MNVTYSGWTEKHGYFHCNVFVDEKKTDYEIHFSSGRVMKQNSAFDVEVHDWNYDGDVYGQFGAWFQEVDENGRFCGGEFWTPEQMVRAVADSLDDSTRGYGDRVVSIPGITIPPLEKRPSFDEVLRTTERRAEAQEAERSRKMDALGIRRSDNDHRR